MPYVMIRFDRFYKIDLTRGALIKKPPRKLIGRIRTQYFVETSWYYQ